jgi:hypothetical protein
MRPYEAPNNARVHFHPDRRAGYQLGSVAALPDRRCAAKGRRETFAVRFIAVSCCRSARFSKTNSRWPRSANANARATTMSSSSMHRSWLASMRKINGDEFWRESGSRNPYARPGAQGDECQDNSRRLRAQRRGVGQIGLTNTRRCGESREGARSLGLPGVGPQLANGLPPEFGSAERLSPPRTGCWRTFEESVRRRPHKSGDSFPESGSCPRHRERLLR